MKTWWPWLAVAAAVVLGIAAAELQRAGWAPVGLLPLGFGIALGAVVAGLTRPLGPGKGRRLALATLALVMVAVEHIWLYVGFRRQWQAGREEHAQLAMFRPEQPWSFGEYLAREFTLGWATYWVVDAAIVMAAAIGTGWFLRRRDPAELHQAS